MCAPMIELRIRQIAQKAGITNAHRLQLAVGLSPDVSQRLWKGDWEKISKETMEKLCKALKCKPGDLFTYQPSPNSK